MIDFYDAPEQITRQIIPPNSCVFVQMKILYPQPNVRAQDGVLTVARSGCSYLATKMIVLSPSFQDNFFYENFVLEGNGDKIQKAIQISRSKIKAALCHILGIDIKDKSDEAKKQLSIESYSDLDGIVFPVKVKCIPSVQPDKTGAFYYTNNAIKKVLTKYDREFEEIIKKEEIITNEKVPVFQAIEDSVCTDATPVQNGSEKLDNVPF